MWSWQVFTRRKDDETQLTLVARSSDTYHNRESAYNAARRASEEREQTTGEKGLTFVY